MSTARAWVTFEKSPSILFTITITNTIEGKAIQSALSIAVALRCQLHTWVFSLANPAYQKGTEGGLYSH